MALRVPNAKVPNARVLLRDGAGKSKYVPKAENSEFSIDRITPQNALNLIRKFSDKELETQYSPGEIKILHDAASRVLRDEIIHITGRDSKGNMAKFNEESIDWLLQNDPLIYRLAQSGSRDAQALNDFCNVKVEELQRSNPELYASYERNSWIKQNDGMWVTNLDTGMWTREAGAITSPPDTLPKVNNKSNMPDKSDFKLNEGDRPVFLIRGSKTPPKEGVVVGPETPAVENPAATSPSPEVIGEAMRDAVSKDGTVTVPPEAVAEEVAKEKANPKAVTDGTEVKTAEAATGKAETPPEKGALIGEGEKPSSEPSKGLLSRMGGHIGRNKKWYLTSLGGLGIAAYAINDLASDNSTIKSRFTKRNYALDTNNPSANQPRIKSLDQREGAYMPERLLRFRQDTQEPFINNTDVNADADYIPVNEELPVQQQKQQPHVVNAPAPVNNATADYVRAAYNSYIPSDAGRAYQKAIYGDPLELERNRLQQQQQQKWRDFVMRSGQSPAELVQRGLMPYDALQYI